jgi:hypothetical protein
MMIQRNIIIHWIIIQCLSGVTDDDPEKHRGRKRASHTEENHVTIEGSIMEDPRVKFRAELQCFMSF